MKRKYEVVGISPGGTVVVRYLTPKGRERILDSGMKPADIPNEGLTRRERRILREPKANPLAHLYRRKA